MNPPPAGEFVLPSPTALQRVRSRRGLGSVLPLLGPVFTTPEFVMLSVPVLTPLPVQWLPT